MDLLRSSLKAEIPHLKRYARALVDHPDEADDLVQASLERALARAGQWNPRRHLRPWLFRIQHNVYVSWVRRRDREQDFQQRYPVPAFIHVNYDAQLELRLVQHAMDDLPMEQREVILLIAVEGLSYEEASEMLVVPVGTVRSRLSRGRRTLRTVLDGHAGQRPGP